MAPRPNFLKAPVLDASGKTTSKTGTYPNSSTKIRQQRNMFQMKKQGKNLQDQRNEEEIGSLSEKKKIRLMIIKMIQNLRNIMEKKINRKEALIEKIQESFNKYLEDVKNR